MRRPENETETGRHSGREEKMRKRQAEAETKNEKEMQTDRKL